MLKNLTKTSIFALLSKGILRGCYFIKAWLGEVCKDSRIYRLTQTFRSATKICFRYSFLGRFTEAKWDRRFAISENIKTVRCVWVIYRPLQEKLISYSRTSAAIDSAGRIKKELYSSPIKISSIIVVAAILTHIFFSLLLNKEIALLGWVARGLFLFLGLGGLFCNADWQDLRKTSFLLGLILKERQ